MKNVSISVLEASQENMSDYGMFLPLGVWLPGLAHPFYGESIVQGRPIPFQSGGEVAIRTAEVSWRGAEVRWLERHLMCSQVLCVLGAESMAIVLGKPNHQDGACVPDLDGLGCFSIGPGEGILLNLGTWHSFPFTMGRSTICLSIVSKKVIDDLVREVSPYEIFTENIKKIDVPRRLGRITIADLSRSDGDEV